MPCNADAYLFCLLCHCRSVELLNQVCQLVCKALLYQGDVAAVHLLHIAFCHRCVEDGPQQRHHGMKLLYRQGPGRLLQLYV